MKNNNRRRAAQPSRVFSSKLQAPTGWIVTRLPVGAVDSARRRRGETGPDTPLLPPGLEGEEFEVLDAVDLLPEGHRRSSGSSAVSLKVELPPDTLSLLVVRQASGAVSFHRPSTLERRSTNTGRSTPVTVEFDIEIRHGDPEVGRRGILGKINAILIKVVKKAADLVVDHLAELTVPWLSHKLEERLWKGRPTGWLHVTRESLAGKSLRPAVPSFPSDQRGLLLLHGTFSNTASAFKGLANEAFFAALRPLYGDNIYGFDHFTIGTTPEQNVRDMLAALPEGPITFDVITHSRGGLVLRMLTEVAASLGLPSNRIKIGRVILVASPNEGTPLATPTHLEDKLSWISNLLEMLPDHPFVTAADWVANSLVWFAQKIVGNAPGLASMDSVGDTIAALQASPAAPAGCTYFALSANFHPPQHWWSRLADMGVDALFGGANDLVVPTEGGWRTDSDSTRWVTPDRIGCFGLGGNLAPGEPGAVTHINFFDRPETAAFILKALRDEPLNLPVIQAAAAMPLRRRGGSSKPLASPMPAQPAETAHTPCTDCNSGNAPPQATLGMEGWSADADLFLTVIAQSNASDMGAEKTTPLLLATYDSARVAVPFYVPGDNLQVNNQWQTIAEMNRFVVGYSNGEESTYILANGTIIESPTEDFLVAYGQVLFQTLFPTEVKRLYDAARFRNEHRRLNIIFSSMIPWIADIPWEFAFDAASEMFLATADVRFVRNVLSPMPTDRIVEKSRLRILVVSAQPTGSVPLSIDEERGFIANAFKDLTAAGLVDVDIIPRATPESLHEAVRGCSKGLEYDVVHFIGHGEFDRDTTTGYLLFEDSGGRTRRLSASQLLDILRSRGIRVVFLNACESGRGTDADYNRGVAMTLVRDGIPTVVANQYSVLDRAASLFSLHLYRCLACGMRIGDSVREARIAIRYSGVEPMDWGVPVLFARNPNARLCGARKATVAFDWKFSETITPGQPSRRRRSFVAGPAGEAQEINPPLKVAIWDVANALPYRENLEAVLAEMNNCQDQFIFQLERITAPRSLWRLDHSKSSDFAYIDLTKVFKPLEAVRAKLGVNFLVCVTDLPLKDDEWQQLYLWQTDVETAMRGCSVMFSTWGFDPPLRGPSFRTSFANSVAIALGLNLSGVDGGVREPKFSVGYFNEERDVEHVAGKLRITAAMKRRMIQKKRISQDQITALETLLGLFHAQDHA